MTNTGERERDYSLSTFFSTSPYSSSPLLFLSFSEDAKTAITLLRQSAELSLSISPLLFTSSPVVKTPCQKLSGEQWQHERLRTNKLDWGNIFAFVFLYFLLSVLCVWLCFFSALLSAQASIGMAFRMRSVCRIFAGNFRKLLFITDTSSPPATPLHAPASVRLCAHWR
ncbi:hypothetical protein AXF42_Ash008698 [Apostasia shenzhenica]|uniref:Uncharacterized protein n=1 Tax=Apostasia shenzhenica TaxID=1088818 RepID=A0A2I0B262_9ASPA|nr:hypothetical protein AXF42_Ash008698 [Apostasia shenzhenica]